MKKVIVSIALVSILAVGALAFAHGPGGRGGHMMGPGYRGQMMGPGYGSQMMGWSDRGHGPDQTFLNETAELRKDIHNKKFEYFEASRDPGTNAEALTKLEKEINEIQTKIREKAPRTAYGGFGGYGRCW